MSRNKSRDLNELLNEVIKETKLLKSILSEIYKSINTPRKKENVLPRGNWIK